MTDIEIWRTAVYDGEIYEGLYKVSNLGKILSLNYRNTGKPGLLNPSANTDGYFVINLRKNRKTKNCYVHRLIAETFLPNPENLPEVNHKIEGDEGKKINMVIFNEDCSVNNEKSTIEWCSREYNHNYKTINERIAKANSKRVLQLTLTGELIKEWESTRECGRNGFNQGNVAACCRGNTKLKTYKGFRWKYK